MTEHGAQRLAERFPGYAATAELQERAFPRGRVAVRLAWGRGRVFFPDGSNGDEVWQVIKGGQTVTIFARRASQNIGRDLRVCFGVDRIAMRPVVTIGPERG